LHQLAVGNLVGHEVDVVDGSLQVNQVFQVPYPIWCVGVTKLFLLRSE
jgi:hypothetical protein